jgi:hypothetical protein
MSKKKLQDAVANPVEQVKRSTNNLLGRVYWILIDKLDLSMEAITLSLNRYVRDPRNGVVQTSHKRSEKISNLTGELTNHSRMSWNKFIEGLKVIEVTRVRITFEVWRGKRDTYAKTVIDQKMSDLETSDEEN